MRRLQDYLEAGDALGRLHHRASRLAALESAYAEVAPEHLSEVSGVSRLESGTLVLWTGSGAVAAKLRQLAPTLLSQLRKRAPECTSIRVTVQVDKHPFPRSPLPERELGEPSVEALRDLAETLPPSPLRSALARLATRNRRRSEDGK